MPENFPQLIPQEYCLSCRGCCRFTLKESPWRPRVSLEEQERFSDSCVLGQSFLKTNKFQDSFICQFLEPESHRCQVYDQRPQECALYPFIFVQKDKKIFLAVHLACPYVQEKRNSQEFSSFLEALKGFLKSDQGRARIRDALAFAYSLKDIEQEIDLIFAL